MNTWFSSDLHLGHRNILKFCNRPFADVEEMDRILIDNWNAVVAPDDAVHVLGDFCYRSKTAPNSYLARLNGIKHLIKGNHDRDATLSASWASVCDYAEINVDHCRIVLMHYGMRVWNGSRRGSYHLYGHSHGNLPGFRTPGGGGCVDVGVDCWWYAPVSLADIRRRIATLPIISQETRIDDG